MLSIQIFIIKKIQQSLQIFKHHLNLRKNSPPQVNLSITTSRNGFLSFVPQKLKFSNLPLSESIKIKFYFYIILFFFL
ncbi:hypothetical protein pb186bvf_018734 [Paramecium bursaria]